jgi:C-terminal processing protease CtpA/Prc
VYFDTSDTIENTDETSANEVGIITKEFTTHMVFINKIPNRRLGFTISYKRGKNLYVKEIDAEPALSSNLRVHDRIVEVNREK